MFTNENENDFVEEPEEVQEEEFEEEEFEEDDSEDSEELE